jgi:hypothetical protein
MNPLKKEIAYKIDNPLYKILEFISHEYLQGELYSNLYNKVHDGLFGEFYSELYHELDQISDNKFGKI